MIKSIHRFLNVNRHMKAPFNKKNMQKTQNIHKIVVESHVNFKQTKER